MRYDALPCLFLRNKSLANEDNKCSSSNKNVVKEKGGSIKYMLGNISCDIKNNLLTSEKLVKNVLDSDIQILISIPDNEKHSGNSFLNIQETIIQPSGYNYDNCKFDTRSKICQEQSNIVKSSFTELTNIQLPEGWFSHAQDIFEEKKLKIEKYMPENISREMKNSSLIDETSEGCITGSDIQDTSSEHNFANCNFHKRNNICQEQSNNEKCSFAELCKNIHLPVGWFSQVQDEEYMVLFEIDVKRSTESNYESYNCFIKRSVILLNNLHINLTALGKNIKPEHLHFPNIIKGHEMLNNLVREYSKLNFCCGIADFDVIKDKISYIDILGCLRHNHCLILTELECCEVCNNVKKIVHQKKNCMSQKEQPMDKLGFH